MMIKNYPDIGQPSVLGSPFCHSSLVHFLDLLEGYVWVREAIRLFALRSLEEKHDKTVTNKNPNKQIARDSEILQIAPSTWKIVRGSSYNRMSSPHTFNCPLQSQIFLNTRRRVRQPKDQLGPGNQAVELLSKHAKRLFLFWFYKMANEQQPISPRLPN